MLKGKLFGRKKDANPLRQMLRKSSLSDMQVFVRGQNEAFPLTDEGIIELLRQLLAREKPSERFPGGKRYVEPSDHDARIKKLFDLFIAVCSSTKISDASLQHLTEFMSHYDDIIKGYDRRNKQIFEEKLKAHVVKAVATVETKSRLHHKYDLLHASAPMK